MNIALSDGFAITDIQPKDKPAYLEHLQEKQIYDQTLNIPFPYTDADADWWLNRVAEETTKQTRSVNWAIRDPEGLLIGGIGFHVFEIGKSHKADLGYWLAKPWWGRGLMTDAVKKVCDTAFAELGLTRITAHVFAFNDGSARVLEKSGFQLEGHLRKHYGKNGEIFDGKLFARLRDESDIESPRPGILHHIDINVSDLKRSTEFWGWLLEKLGYQKYSEWKHGIGWRLGETYLDIVQVEPKYVENRYHRKNIGLNHLAFHARSKEHVDQLTRELKERGIAILYQDRHPYAGGPNYYAVFFEDPDRIKVEVAAP